jgi:hypothetical protein
MDVDHLSSRLLEQEARGLLARLDQVRPLALGETMVLAAALPARAQYAMERALHAGRTSLRHEVAAYIRWLQGPGRRRPAAERQRRFVFIRLRFNAILSQLDLFSEVITQRSEQETGVWLSGLDALARDALEMAPLPEPPAVVCMLIRGPGASIRRARTRLPGGDPNPVAIVQIPRERMVGHGIASSLVHEVGHQAAALLGLVGSLKPSLERRAEERPADAVAWRSWASTCSEIVADAWSVGALGISSTLGLLAVVSLPRFFVFRPPGRDPHPSPYIRVLVSARMGDALYPHPQWHALEAMWRAFYPVDDLPEPIRGDLAVLERTIPDFVNLLLDHPLPSLDGRPLRSVFPLSQRQPGQLVDHFRTWAGDRALMARQPPALVFAAIGQARAAQLLTPEAETELLGGLLQLWALRSSLAGVDLPQLPHRSLARAS